MKNSDIQELEDELKILMKSVKEFVCSAPDFPLDGDLATKIGENYGNLLTKIQELKNST
jgi:hypothetical protein